MKGLGFASALWLLLSRSSAAVACPVCAAGEVSGRGGSSLLNAALLIAPLVIAGVAVVVVGRMTRDAASEREDDAR